MRASSCWQTAFVNRETVVLTGDHHHVVIYIFAPDGWRHDDQISSLQFWHLRPEPVADDPEQIPNTGILVCENFGDGFNSIVTGLWIARAIGQKYAIGIHRQYFRWRVSGWNHCQFAVTINQHAQYIALYAVVVGHYFKFAALWLCDLYA